MKKLSRIDLKEFYNYSFMDIMAMTIIHGAPIGDCWLHKHGIGLWNRNHWFWIRYEYFDVFMYNQTH